MKRFKEKNKIKLTLCVLEALMQVLWQTVKTQMKCISSGFGLFAKTKLIFTENTILLFETITCDPSMYMMDHNVLTESNFMGNSIFLQRVI